MGTLQVPGTELEVRKLGLTPVGSQGDTDGKEGAPAPHQPATTHRARPRAPALQMRDSERRSPSQGHLFLIRVYPEQLLFCHKTVPAQSEGRVGRMKPRGQEPSCRVTGGAVDAWPHGWSWWPCSLREKVEVPQMPTTNTCSSTGAHSALPTL